jgi:hydrogenase expression/formation protein HypD
MVENYPREIVLMEVCGTHTMSISRSGLRRLLPENIRLLSGPGCPVCVTPNYYLDKAIAYARKKDVLLTTFGDMIKVPGSSSSLEKEKGERANIFVVYSPLDALKIAQNNPEKKIIFLGVGFETTAPTLAATLQIARRKKIQNFLIFSGHKLIPPAMEALLKDQELHLDGFICPGHVSTIIGSKPYEFIARDYHIPCVIAGFEPLDVVQAIFMSVQEIVEKRPPQVQIQYSRLVKEEGNKKALELMEEVFETEKSNWRGLGDIPGSGLKIKENFFAFDAEVNLPVEAEKTRENKACICGAILRGVKTPLDCSLFKKECRPENPVGACMVSSEGTCAAYFKYEE